MESSQKTSLLFPIALVLFEFSVYIANDMIQPNMLAVVHEFLVSASWIPTSLTAFTFGGALLPWIIGPLSDHIGRRPVMLVGVALFVIACFATQWTHEIHSFIALRLVQGMGLSFISAIGYATVQEVFAEKRAVRLTALMANVGLLAPLIGPLLGTILAQCWPWRACFWLIGGSAALALIGLYRSMPESVQVKTRGFNLRQVCDTYRQLLTDRAFVQAAACFPLLGSPLLGWIALSPVMLVTDSKMSLTAYGLWQLPVVGALIAGNLLLAHGTQRWPLGRSLALARWPMGIGAAVMISGCLLGSKPLYFLIAGLTLIAFAEGMCFAVLYRFALTASPLAKGTVAACITMTTMLIFALDVALLQAGYSRAGFAGYALLTLVFLLLYSILVRGVASAAMQAREHALTSASA